jgi:hypothetical protein
MHWILLRYHLFISPYTLQRNQQRRGGLGVLYIRSKLTGIFHGVSHHLIFPYPRSKRLVVVVRRSTQLTCLFLLYRKIKMKSFNLMYMLMPSGSIIDSMQMCPCMCTAYFNTRKSNSMIIDQHVGCREQV